MRRPQLLGLHEEVFVKTFHADFGRRGGFVRLESGPISALSGIDLVDWISRLDTPEHFYFSGKEGDYEAAGAGCCEVLQDCLIEEAEARLVELWKTFPEVIVFSGMSFFGDGPSPGEWDGFGALRLTVPLLEITRRNGETRLAANGLSMAGEAPESAVKRLKERLAVLREFDSRDAPSGFPGTVFADEVPGRPGWDKMMARTLNEIRSGNIDKAVLSRKRVLVAERAWPVFGIMGSLKAVRDKSFVFLYKISREKAFLGRSPERLLKVSGRAISVDAVAGTRPRGATPAADRAFARELLESMKELSEHRIVSGCIREQMEKITVNPTISDTESLLALENVQHIITRHSGTLKNGRSVLNTLRCFHPTPAVGGYPSLKALSLLFENEPHERGWFAAPIGWMNGHDADFAVGIRSALVAGNALHVFAGAGIVDGSRADDEWLETEQKMRTIIGASEGF